MAYQPAKWEEKFLAAYAKNGNITESAKLAKIDRSTVYRRKEDNPEFVERMQETHDQAVESLEKVAWDRAKKSSDTLLIFLLKSLKPETYRETTRHEVSGNLGIDLNADTLAALYNQRRSARAGQTREDTD